MDYFEAAKVVSDRIQKLEPEHVTKKIVGYILLQELNDREMIRLAFGPDNLIRSWIQEAKTRLQLPSKPAISPPISPSMNPSPILEFPHQYSPTPISPRPFSSSATYKVPAYLWDPQLPTELQPVHDSDVFHQDYRFQNLTQFVDPEDQFEAINQQIAGFPSEYYYPEAALGNFRTRGNRHSVSAPEFPVKACHYFKKGFCKHGSSCRYFHGQSFSESHPHMFGSIEAGNEDHVLSPVSLEKLESEITELLKSRKGNPVSIASLPMIYYEKYGRALHAEGYLTESQRHGKAGYSLTKLLARLKNSIRLIERPHGQHSIILAEDAPKYVESQGERNDPGPVISGSRQIYLTFPAESTFTEEDVSNYFSAFGPVEDVRIPCQQKRMFGFVTFVSSDTVKMILSKGNPHYVCGARVLVKPYREKSKLIDRKYSEKFDCPHYFHSNHIDMDSEFQTRWESSKSISKQMIDDREQALELERLHLSELHLRKQHINNSYLGYCMNEFKVSEDQSKFSPSEPFNFLLDALNIGSTSDDNFKQKGSNCSDQDSNQGLNLPDSPFASPIASGISTLI